MSAKQYNLYPHVVLDEVDVADDIASDVTDIFNKDNITYQILWTGDLEAVFEVQVSSDYDSRNPDAATWDTVPVSPSIAATGTADSWTVDINQLGSRFVRVFMTQSAGSADTLQIKISGKGI